MNHVAMLDGFTLNPSPQMHRTEFCDRPSIFILRLLARTNMSQHEATAVSSDLTPVLPLIRFAVMEHVWNPIRITL